VQWIGLSADLRGRQQALWRKPDVLLRHGLHRWLVSRLRTCRRGMQRYLVLLPRHLCEQHLRLRKFWSNL
jgi:hypothetical protein